MTKDEAEQVIALCRDHNLLARLYSTGTGPHNTGMPQEDGWVVLVQAPLHLTDAQQVKHFREHVVPVLGWPGRD